MEYHEKMKRLPKVGLSQNLREILSSKKGTRSSRPLYVANQIETEVEELKLFRALPGLPDSLIEEMRIREPMLECQTGVTEKVESHLHPRYKQMKDTRPFEEIMSEQISDGLSDQTRLSVLRWTAGPKRGKVANSVVAPFHVILQQEAESHFHEIEKMLSSNSTSSSADQLILFHK